MLAAALGSGRHARAELHRLHGVDAHEGVRDIGIEAVEHGLPESRRHAARDHGDARTDRVARGADLPDQLFELRDPCRIGAEEWILVGERGVDRRERERADLAQVSVDAHAEAARQVTPRDRTRRGAHHRLARARASAAAIVAYAVLLLVGVVGMPGAEAVLDLLVVARPRVGVLDHEPDGRAGGASFEHAGEDAHLVALAALADEVRGAGAPAVDVLLQVRLAQLEPRRTAVDDAPERRAVTLAEGGDREELADGVAGHGSLQLAGSCSRVIRNTPPPPRSNSSHRNGSCGNARATARSVLPTSTMSRPLARRWRRASRRMTATESRPRGPAASATRGSCRYSGGNRSSSRAPT